MHRSDVITIIAIILTVISVVVISINYQPPATQPEQVPIESSTVPLQARLDQCQDLQYSYLAALTGTSQLLDIYKKNCIEYCEASHFDGQFCEKQCRGELVE